MWGAALRRVGGIAEGAGWGDGEEPLHVLVDGLGEGLVLLHRRRVQYPHTGLLVGAQRPFDERRPASRVGAAAFARRRRGGPAAFGCRAGAGDPLQVYWGMVALQVYGVVVLTNVPLQASVRRLAVAGSRLLRVRGKG